MDFYVILGLERGATLADVKRAYKRLARKHHPDINPGDRMAAVKFRQIAEAYETLSDPERRQRYDTTGATAFESGSSGVGFDGFDFTVSVAGSDASTFGDLFADVFQLRETRRTEGGPERGVDLHQVVALDFEEAMRGGQRDVTVTRQEHCPQCQGRGRLSVAETRCAHCGGSGAIRQARCPACGGQQVVMRTESLTINIPPGLGDGARIRLQGKGHAGPNGGEAGDLYITVQVRPHARFSRDGDDLCITVPIAIHEAALGAKIEVPSIDGPARLRVPPGTQSGQRFRIRERGVPSPRDGRRGDLVVEVRLMLPKLLDERSKELLREFGRINSENLRRDL